MAKRYENLTKISPDPLSRLLAVAEMELSSDADIPGSADTEYALRVLDAQREWDEILMVLSVALPPRESVWWSCLAARDFIKLHPKTPQDCVKAAEAWVFDPNDKTLGAVETVLENSSTSDKTTLCATAALYGSGTMGTGDMANIAAPPSAVSATVFGMNMLAMSETDDPERHMQWLIDRGLDIARGGNGQVPRPPPTVYEDEDEDEIEEEGDA